MIEDISAYSISRPLMPVASYNLCQELANLIDTSRLPYDYLWVRDGKDICYTHRLSAFMVDNEAEVLCIAFDAHLLLNYILPIMDGSAGRLNVFRNNKRAPEAWHCGYGRLLNDSWNASDISLSNAICKAAIALAEKGKTCLPKKTLPRQKLL